MADDFDDLFKSPSSGIGGGPATTPGWGNYGEDDLTTANPFADLQSSRLYESQINTPEEDEGDGRPTESSGDNGLARQFGEKASLSRRSTTSSKASTTSSTAAAAAAAASQNQRGGVQRSSSTRSSASTASADGARTTAPSSSEGASEQRRDRVAVSPFIAPSDDGGPATPSDAHLSRSEATIGESEFSAQQSPYSNGAQSHVPFWSRSASTSVYDQEENAAFGGGFGDAYNDNDRHAEASSSSTPAPGLNVHHAEEQDDEHGGFGGQTRDDDDHLRARDTEDAASIRTVGLESDNASLRSHRTLIHPTASPQETRLSDDPDGKPTFIVTVSDPTKIGSAIDPINQHTVYTVRTRTSSSQFRKQDFSVLRRYRDFLWLFERLNENNPGVVVPPPPEKAAMGRFSQSFVESRRAALQRCLAQILKHPLLYTDPDLRLFLESDTFVTDVKQRALSVASSSMSASGILGHAGDSKPSFFSSLTGSRFVEFDEYFDLKRSSLDALEVASKGLTKHLVECTKQRTALAAASSELMSALNNLASCELSTPVKEALVKMADLEKRKAEIGEMQTKDEEQILLGTAENYARLISSIRHAFSARVKAYQAWQKSETAVKTARSAHEKAKRQQKTNPDLVNQALYDITEAERRSASLKRDFEEVSRLIKSEMIRFDKEKTSDFKDAIEKYSERLAIRQREIVEAWKRFVEVLETGIKGSKAEQAGSASEDKPKTAVEAS